MPPVNALAIDIDLTLLGYGDQGDKFRGGGLLQQKMS